MGFLTTFFELNRSMIYFGYGLVFFVLGLAIALQSRQSSRLDLARSLSWLAAFGLTHAFHEWGDLFIPIQQAYLSTGLVDFLYRIHLLLLAVSFTFLFEFGVTLLSPLGRMRWLHGVSAGLLAVWIFVVYFPLATLIPNFDVWHNSANALARYFIGFPAGLLAAYGLRVHTVQRIAPLEAPHIFHMLELAGWLLALYAVFAGLVPSPAPFFPANVVNAQTFEAMLVIPPQLVRSFIGLGLALAIIRGLQVFDLETQRMIETMEKQQILTSERERIARELHDGAIQKVYTAGLLVQSADRLVETDHPVLRERLDKAVEVLNDAISDLRRNLVELHTTPGEEPLAGALRHLVQDPRFKSLVDIALEIDLPENETLSPPRSEHVLAILNEALSNVVRHSHADHVLIKAVCTDGGRFQMTIEDDGVSLPKNFSAGYGLRNMRDRARLLGGNLDVGSKGGNGGKGTRVWLDIPWRDERG